MTHQNPTGSPPDPRTHEARPDAGTWSPDAAPAGPPNPEPGSSPGTPASDPGLSGPAPGTAWPATTEPTEAGTGGGIATTDPTGPQPTDTRPDAPGAPDREPATPAVGPLRSRTGGLWVASVLFAIILLLLLIFVLENGQSAEISFFGQHGHLPQGVALLLAAVSGILLVAIPGTARIIQLRLRDRRRSRRARRS